VRNGIDRLPTNCRQRSMPGVTRYEKQLPGHHVQVDVKSLDFIDHLIERFPFRVHTIRTDNGHGFQVRFHWHVEDLGIRHVYIKPTSPDLNGKVERPHLTGRLESYQLLDHTGDVDLRKKFVV
jgi:transposase InsO family protein